MGGERDLCDLATRCRHDRLRVVEESLALGLLEVKKWDRIYSWRIESEPASVQLKVADSFTEDEIADFRETARRMLREYVAEYINIRLERSECWWRGFGQGVPAAFAYSLGIVLIAIIIKILGSDVATVFKFLMSR